MRPEPRAARRRAAVLVILAAVLWWHAWMPAVLFVAFVAWVVLHKQFEGELGERHGHAWRRVWPPTTLVLVAAIIVGTAVYCVSDYSIEAKVLPVALNALALAMLVIRRKRAVAVHAPSEASTLDDFAAHRERA